MLKENSTILFQGDSITDAGRTYSDDPNWVRTPTGLGVGYPYKVKQFLDTFFADKNITVLNRGISGNRAIDLKNRWDEDCIALKPDYVSILIGVNDMWRRYDSNDATTTEQYETNFRAILQKAKDALNCDFIILEPFLIPADEGKIGWYEDLTGKIQSARKLAREFDATFIPLDGIFAVKSTEREPSYWSEDGVHPTDAGHSFIARLWLDAMLKG